MSSRRALLLLALLLFGSVLAVSVAFARRGDTSPASYRGSETPGAIRLPSFRLRDWTGALVDSRRLRGRVVLVTFLETKCKEACPVIADQIGEGLQLLRPAERRGVYALAISTHPGDDTPARVREFLRVHRVQGKLHYLIGTESHLRPVWRSFHVLAALDSGDADTHSAPVRIFDRQGKWVSTLHPGADLNAENLAHDVRVALGSP